MTESEFIPAGSAIVVRRFCNVSEVTLKFLDFEQNNEKILGMESPLSRDINVLALVKGNERYIFLYDDDHRADTLRHLGKFAAHPELSFTWYDAAVLSQKIRQKAGEVTRQSKRFILPLDSESQ